MTGRRENGPGKRIMELKEAIRELKEKLWEREVES